MALAFALAPLFHACFPRTPSLQSGKTFSTIAEFVRRNMEKEYGRGWNCIVGTSFGAYVTHEIKTYVYFSVAAGVSVLVWRT